jgi:hypothetical protein
MLLTVRRLALILTLLVPGHRCAAQELELSELFEHIRLSPPDRAAFREVRHNPLFQQPMELSGYLEYPRAGQLRKVIEQPFEETMAVDGDTLELTRDGRTKRLSLKNRESILAFLRSIESLLAGDAAMLEALFEVELSGTLDSWRLRLVPASGSLGRQLELLTVSGGPSHIEQIRFDMTNGEWQRLEIVPDEPGT